LYNHPMPMKTADEQRAYQLRWVTKRRTDWITENGPCKKCGSSESLEVDHIDPSTKSMHPAQIWGRREEERRKELAKCQVLCKPCHRKKTNSELRRAPCGTNSKYRAGCRCAACLADHMRYDREWRKRKKAGRERQPRSAACKADVRKGTPGAAPGTGTIFGG
jgi:hypothetical protein